jgi:hypothetical protein
MGKIIINKKKLEKTLTDGFKNRIKSILTPSEFQKVRFIKRAGKPDFQAPPEICEKIKKNL